MMLFNPICKATQGAAAGPDMFGFIENAHVPCTLAG